MSQKFIIERELWSNLPSYFTSSSSSFSSGLGQGREGQTISQ